MAASDIEIYGGLGPWGFPGADGEALLMGLDLEGVRLLVRDLNQLYLSDPVLSRNDFNSQGFRWLSCQDADANVISYLRSDAEEKVLYAAVCHFGGAMRDFRVGVPRRGFWREVINTNSQYYGGTGVGNDGGRAVEDIPHDGFSQSIRVTLPPLSAFVFKWNSAD